MNSQWPVIDSALDLSTLRDTARIPNLLGQTNSDVIVFPASVISLPYSDKIPFYISPSGHLVLAHFITECANGELVFKKLPFEFDQQNFLTGAQNNNAHPSSVSMNDQLGTGNKCLPTENADEENTSTHETATHKENILSQYVYKLLKQYKLSSGLVNGRANADIVVEGHNLSALVNFAEQFSRFRRSIALSQSQLSRKISTHFPQQSFFSQSFICRFEKMHVTLRAALRAQPYLQLWLDGMTLNHIQPKQGPRKAVGKSYMYAQARVDGYTSLPTAALVKPTTDANERYGSSDSKTSCTDPTLNNLQISPTLLPGHPLPVRRCRKTRTHFSLTAICRMSAYFKHNPSPKGSQLNDLASELGYSRESVRMWFCNRRQSLHAKHRKNKNSLPPCIIIS